MPTPLDRRRFLARSAASAAALLAAREGFAQATASTTAAPAPSAPGPSPAPAVVRLGQNENPWGPSEAAKRAAAEAVASGNRYVQGVAELERKLASREGLAPEQVVLGSGSHALLCMAAAAWGAAGAEVVTAEPTYPGLGLYAEAVGGKVVRVPLDAAFRTDLAGMEARVGPATGLVYVCNPANPSGTVVDPAALRGFCERVSAKAVVVVDEAYRDYPDASRFASMLPLVKEGRNVVLTYTFSKLHGLAGLRVGYAMAPPALAAALRKVRMGGAPLAVSNVAVAAAAASLDDVAFLDACRKRTVAGRAALAAFLREEGFAPPPSETNFVFVPMAAGVPELAKALEARGVRVSARDPKHGLRVTVGTEEEMARFRAAFREARGALAGA
jgi:histidinol-phosphate aminotransferase